MNAKTIIAALALVIASSPAVTIDTARADSPANITTPRGSPVPDTYYLDEMSQADIDAANAAVAAAYPAATMISDASRTYNCHGWAWHTSVTVEYVWIGVSTATAEDIYWEDGSYCEVPDEASADNVSYASDNHSAVTYDNAGTFWSKWGSYPLMEHAAAYCPYNSSSLKYYCRNDDPGAEIEGFTVANGVASWDLETLHRTESLALEGRNGKDEEWKPLGVAVPLSIGHAEVGVGGYEYYRLVETETTGARRFLGEVRAQAVDAKTLAQPRPREAAPSLEDAKARVEALQAQTLASGNWKTPPAAVAGAPIVIYTRSVMQTAVNSAIASFWTSRGYSVTVKLVDGYPSNPDLFRSTLDADIAAEALSGAGYFLLVGDANDWREFTQPWPGEWEAIRQSRLNGGYPPGEPARDLIPTWVVWDTRPRGEGMPYYNPYWFTDQPYADTNGDDVPDVVVGRLPFTTATEVYAYATKLWDETATWDADEIVYTIGNRTYWEPGDGTRARLAAERTQQHIPAWVTTHTLRWSQTVYDIDRNLMPAALINTYQPGLLIQMASLSNRYYPGDFFDKTIGITPWTMSLLTTNKPMLFVAASCGGADYARTEKASGRPPVAEMFLLAASKGAVAWIGPTAGTWQNGNEAVVTCLIDELYTHPDQPMGKSFHNAIRRVLLENADNAEIVETARSYEFLGDPLVPFMYNAPPPPPGGGCPYVYTFNGSEFAQDNTILKAVPRGSAGRVEANAADAYVLQTPLADDDGVYRIEIREFEREHSYIDRVELLAVDHPEGTELMLTDEGRLIVHRDWLLPVAARSSTGEDLLAVLSQRDNAVFEGRAGDEVILTYRVPNQVAVGIGTVVKKKHVVEQPPYPVAARTLGIEAFIGKPGGGDDVSLGAFSPRENASPHTRFVPDELLVENSVEGQFEIRLVWHTDHALDFAGLFAPLQMDPPAQTLGLEGASHPRGADAQSSLGEVDGRFVELVPGEALSLRFASTALPAGQKRSFVLLADGHYESLTETDDPSAAPAAQKLYANRPNPFNPTTTICFDLPAPARATLAVYSVDGKLVATLTDREYPAGRHDVEWNGLDRSGQPASSGVYFYTLRTPFGSETRKMTLLK